MVRTYNRTTAPTALSRHRNMDTQTGAKALRHLGFAAAGAGLTGIVGAASAALAMDAYEYAGLASGLTAATTGGLAVYLGSQTVTSFNLLRREAVRGLRRLGNRGRSATNG